MYTTSLISLIGNGSKLTYRIPEGLDLTDGEYLVCLKNLTTTNSIPNVSAEKGDKIKYSTNNGSTWKIITFPKGAYEIVTLNEYLEQALKLNGDQGKIRLSFNTTEYNIHLTLQSGVWIDMTISDAITEIIGFKPLLYKASTTSQINPKLKPTKNVHVKTNITEQTGNPWGYDRVIASIPITVPPGYDIIYTHVVEDKFACLKQKFFEVEVYLLGQDGKEIDFRSEECTITLSLNKKYE